MKSVTAIDYDPLAPLVQADPYPFYAALRRGDPVHYVESLDAYAVSRHADVRHVMHDYTAFSSEAMAQLVARPAEYAANAFGIDDAGPRPVSIVGTDGQTHTRLRLIVNRGFTPRRMAAIEQDVRAVAASYVERLVANGEGDLVAGLAVPFPTVVIAALLGVDPDRREHFRRWSEHMVLAVFEPTDAEQQQAIACSGREMAEWLDAAAAERTDGLGDDLISVLLRAELEGGALDHEELRAFVFTLLVAGSITTAYLIGNAAMTLAQDAHLLSRARLDPAIIPGIVEESLRFDSPTQLMFRTATTPTEVAGTTIPKGATVLPLIGSANRDEHAFPEPDRFDPDRNTLDHISFGHGVHFCLGAALARLEARVALEELVARSSRLDQAGDVARVSSVVFRGPTCLPLRFT